MNSILLFLVHTFRCNDEIIIRIIGKVPIKTRNNSNRGLAEMARIDMKLEFNFEEVDIGDFTTFLNWGHK